jgi:hypothetical protein
MFSTVGSLNQQSLTWQPPTGIGVSEVSVMYWWLELAERDKVYVFIIQVDDRLLNVVFTIFKRILSHFILV